MALSDTSKTLLSIKKLVGKAHTSNDKDVANESLPSGITLSSNSVFGQSIPTTANQTNNTLYTILTGSGISGNGQVEYLRLQSTFIAGSDTTSGRHGFELKLPSDYESNSKNPLAGTYPFLNNQSINITSGSLQLIPPSYALAYEAKPFYGGNTTKDNGTQIPVLDARDWFLDYFNGVFFQQDPPGTGDHANNPDHIQAYLYIGKFASDGYFGLGLSGSLTQLTDGSSYLAAGANITITSASNGQVVIASTAGGSGSPGGATTQIQFNDAGSFGGDADLTYNKTTNALQSAGVITASLGFSGSLTQLSDGTSYIQPSTGIKVTSASNGSITIKVNKEMVFNELLGGNVNGNNTLFTLSNTPFASNEISIFVNGQLQTPPDITTFQDYSVTGSNVFFTTGSMPGQGSLIMAMYNKVVS